MFVCPAAVGVHYMLRRSLDFGRFAEMSSETDDDEPPANCLKSDLREDTDKPSIVWMKEVLETIIKQLPVKEQIRQTRVCTLWKSVVNKSLMAVKTLDLNDCLPSDPLWHYESRGFEILESVIRELGPNLTSLRIPGGSRGQFHPSEIFLLSTQCKKLRHLCFELTDRSLSAFEHLGCLWGLGSQLTSLKLTLPEPEREVRLVFERDLGISLSSMKNLQHLEIECLPNAVECQLEGYFLAELSSSIVSVTLSHLRRIDDELLTNFIRLHPGLKHFELNSVRYAYPMVPTLLARYCTGLKSLKITGCTWFSFEPFDSTPFATAFRSLTQLDQVDVAPNCLFNDLDLKSLCANCPNLTVLRLGKHNGWLPSQLASQPAGQKNTSRLSVDGLNHLGVLINLKFVSLDCLPITTAEIVTALCGRIGADVEDFHFRTNRAPNGWRKFTEAGMNQFVRATEGQSFSKFIRIEVDRVSRRVWLKQSTQIGFPPIHVEIVHP